MRRPPIPIIHPQQTSGRLPPHLSERLHSSDDEAPWNDRHGRKAVGAQLEKIETYLLPLDQATPEAHRKKLASQIELWGPIIEKAGIQAE